MSGRPWCIAFQFIDSKKKNKNSTKKGVYSPIAQVHFTVATPSPSAPLLILHFFIHSFIRLNSINSESASHTSPVFVFLLFFWFLCLFLSSSSFLPSFLLFSPSPLHLRERPLLGHQPTPTSYTTHPATIIIHS